MTGLKVLVVDDHPLFRFGLCAALAQRDDIEVVGEAAGGQAAIAAATGTEPDVVVMDLHLPDLGGVEATRAITNANPRIGVLVLTMFDDSESVFNAMRAGARGYLLKGAEPDELVRAVQAVARGEAIFGQSIAAQVLRYFNGLNASTVSFPELTAREREVLELIAAGRNNSEIAQVLSLSGKTVRNHVSTIFGKLRVADRAQAIVRAREAGLGQRPGAL
ncbi:MAG TPA: response regulator transcription factor [Jatrophihabitans sp.]|jgi:DNA-binding NarL/FixJ family response regulator|nr:response regulator transcription factor [Jatrophihabitans sp.]